jgi:hypothetical protein
LGIGLGDHSQMNTEIYVRNSTRINYININLGELLDKKPDLYFKTAGARMLSAGRDVYGENSEAIVFLNSVLATGQPDPSLFDRVVINEPILLIQKERAYYFGLHLAYDLLWIHRRDIEGFLQDSLFGFWELLKNSGMSDQLIGLYFEDFDDDTH